MTIEELRQKQLDAGEAYLTSYPSSKFGNGKKATLVKAIEQSVKVQRQRVEQWGGLTLTTKGEVEVEASLQAADIRSLAIDCFGPLGQRDMWPYVMFRTVNGDVLREKGIDAANVRVLSSRSYDMYIDETALYRLYARKKAAVSLDWMLIYLSDRHGYGSMETASLRVKARKGQSVTRAVQAALKKWWLQDPDFLAAFDRFHERLGQLWATRRKGWRVEFSAAADSFLNLGHFGETNSCFRAGGQHEASKLALMQTPKAVVVKFYSGEEPAPAARAWGFWFEGVGLLVSNLYKLEWGQARPILESAVSELLGGAKIVFEERVDLANRMVDKSLVYTNGDQKLFAPDPKELRKAILSFAEQVKAMKCGACGTVEWGEELEHRCEQCARHLCHDCVRNARFQDGTTQVLCQGCLGQLPNLECWGCHDHFVVQRGTTGCAQCNVWYCATCEAGRDEPIELAGGRCQECRREEEEREARMTALAPVARQQYDMYEPGCTCERCQAAYRQAAENAA